MVESANHKRPEWLWCLSTVTHSAIIGKSLQCYVATTAAQVEKGVLRLFNSSERSGIRA